MFGFGCSGDVSQFVEHETAHVFGEAFQGNAAGVDAFEGDGEVEEFGTDDDDEVRVLGDYLDGGGDFAEAGAAGGVAAVVDVFSVGSGCIPVVRV